MEIRIIANGEAADDSLRSLHRFLLTEEEIRRSASISLSFSNLGNEAMGGGIDAIKLVLDTGFAAANLALAILAWRNQRSSKASQLLIVVGNRVDALEGTDEDMRAQIMNAIEDGSGLDNTPRS